MYAPAAIAGIGSLPDTIMDRAVVVRMRRRAPDERVRDYRERTTRPDGDALRELLAKWAADVADRVGDPWPQMPPGVADRPADVWEPLLMVADLAAGRTGTTVNGASPRRGQRWVSGVVSMVEAGELAAGSRPRLAADTGRRPP